MPAFLGESIAQVVNIKIMWSKRHHTHFRFSKNKNTFDLSQAIGVQGKENFHSLIKDKH